MLNDQVERCLWLVFVAASLHAQQTAAGYVTAFHACLDWAFDGELPKDGFAMSVVLPVVVLQSLRLESFALLTSLGMIVAWRKGSTVGLSLLGVLPALVYSLKPLICWKYGCFMILWWLMQRSLGSIMKKGESLLTSSLSGAVVTLFLFANAPNKNNIYANAAVSGLMGCSLACFATNCLSERLLWLRLAIQGIGALASVEVFFWFQAIDYPFPRCLFWIFGDFLPRTESFKDDISLQVPNFMWLVYWSFVLLITIPLSPTERTHPILARKWFHFIALLLFVPVTLLAPNLQSLSYAVALALLLVFENARKQVPPLNRFYKTYLDKTKGETEDNAIIVSHLALIIGCAAPLYMLQWVESVYDEKHPQRVLVSLWGVFVLGIGDSMGAIIGKKYGRTTWVGQKRTLEGSMAMLVCLILVCYVASRDVLIWLPAVVFVTALEAFTTQLDNLALPLAGSSLLLLQCRVLS